MRVCNGNVDYNNVYSPNWIENRMLDCTHFVFSHNHISHLHVSRACRVSVRWKIGRIGIYATLVFSWIQANFNAFSNLFDFYKNTYEPTL